MTKTLIRRDTPGTALSADLPPLLNRLYASRGVTTSEDLDLALRHLLPPADLKGIPEAVAVLSAALDAGERILIVGDFDCDGATSSALMVSVLRSMGASAEYLVPNRFEYGYEIGRAHV